MLRSAHFFLKFATPLFIVASQSTAYAQTIPGAADPGRVILPKINLPLPPYDTNVAIPEMPTSITLPKEAKSIHFILKEIMISGNTAFTFTQLHDIFSPYVGKDITLDTAWLIAGQITERYHQTGYFLSRAYVPAQEIEQGRLKITVVEGYVGSVESLHSSVQNSIITRLIAGLKKQQPVTAQQLESFMLRLNDLPGLKFHGVILPDKTLPEGAVKLSLETTQAKPVGVISADNYGSRFLGPYQTTATYGNPPTI